MGSSRSKSRKQSAANFQTPPKPTVFFLDRSLGKLTITDALRKANVKVEIHDDHFKLDEKDIEWLKFVGEKGWFVITKDDRIRYRPLERMALINSGVGAFIVTCKGLNGQQIADLIIPKLSSMYKLIERSTRPFIAKITRDGVSIIVDCHNNNLSQKKRKK